MDNAVHIGSRLIQPRVDEHFLWRLEPVIARDFLAVKINSDNVTGSDEAKPGFFRPPGFD
jgi:hypothetical protein